MKENNFVEFFSKLGGSNELLLVFAWFFIISLTSCSREELSDTVELDSFNLEAASTSAASTGTTIREMEFTAVAQIQYCHGEDIRFTGTIENRVSKTTDARGVIHYTRSFRTKGMTGTGLISGDKYDVLGGAEMFAVQDAVLNPDGTLNLAGSLAESDIVIHQGTLVFRNREDGSQVVARHVIRKVPGRETISEWRCGGKR